VAHDIADLIGQADAGNGEASQRLFASLYDELHRLAERQLARSGSDLSLGTTTLVHEAYLDIAGREGTHFPDRARFMGYAARAMRTVVIDHVRRAHADKRGGGAMRITLTGELHTPAGLATDADSLDRLGLALDELAEVEPTLAQLVDLHFFCGFSLVEIAAMRDVSERTIQRDWRKARLFLAVAMREDAT
jgi:RNA polymerase sigma factor (TIGR02999 family)